MSNRSPWTFLTLFAAGLTACGADDPTPTTVAQDKSELNGRIIYESSSDRYVDPFTAVDLEHSAHYARTVGASQAFEQCVDASMYAQYMNCDDPHPSYPRSAQIGFAWGAFNAAGNDLSYGRRPQSDKPGASASAHSETGDPYGTHHTTFYDGWTTLDNRWDSSVWNHYRDYEPWHWRTGTIIHEFMHTLGYKHMDDEGSQQACADRHNRPSYYAQGQPSLPYIYGNCASSIVVASYQQCNAGSLRGDCPQGSMKLLQNWNGTYGTEQTSETCVCVQDPRHLIALKSVDTGRYVGAANGGGGATTTTAQSVGPSQLFYAIDRQHEFWWGDDPVYLKAFNGDYLRYGSDGTYRADSNAPVDWALRELWGSGAIENGSVVTLRQGTGYAYNDGSTLRWSSQLVLSDDRYHFRVEEPRRDHLIYLLSPHGYYVNADISGERKVWNQRFASELWSDDRPKQASAAFWVVQWTNTERDLSHGDVISLEGFQNDAHFYLSVADGDHTGQVRMASSVGTYERFTIVKTNGTTGPIGHDDPIALRSANGTYVVAMPYDYFDHQIRNYGTFIGDWTKFRFRFVSQFDRPRPTW